MELTKNQERELRNKCLLASEMESLVTDSRFQLFISEAERLIKSKEKAELRLPDEAKPDECRKAGQLMRVERRGMSLIAYLPQTLIAEGEEAAGRLEKEERKKEEERDPRDEFR